MPDSVLSELNKSAFACNIDDANRLQKEKGQPFCWRKVYQDLWLKYYAKLGQLLSNVVGSIQKIGVDNEGAEK